MSSPLAEMQVRVRPATTKDFEAVAQLLTQIGRPAPTPETRGPMRGTWERHLARPEAASLVAERDGRVVGFMKLDFRDRLNHVTWEAWIPELVVAEGMRHLGVGQALLAAAFKEAATKNAHRIVLETETPSEEAHRFFIAAGMREVGNFYEWRRG